MKKLDLDQNKIIQGRKLAFKIAQQIQIYIDANTTVTVERAVLRLLGIDGINEAGIPLVNILIDDLYKSGVLGKGAMYWLINAIIILDKTPQQIAEKVAIGKLKLSELSQVSDQEIINMSFKLAKKSLSLIKFQKQKREQLIQKFSKGREPMLYVIVATGNIYDDAIQAKAAARQGADIVAIIRTTGQSLLDYVPYGPTTEGFGGTYATQANFKIIRSALDEVGHEINRYIYLTNYCSGLCMPEIAAMGAIERLDIMLNDSMYGIIFRDINMKRTFIDQFFSRLINGYAGIIINTGEDNYLTTADAIEAAHTVLASNFINEQFAFLCGMQSNQIGLGHAFEINPEIKNGFLYELAHAQLIREIFPENPIKYMPPTKHMTGNIFKGHVQDALFNVCSSMTGQSIHLLGMLTEAIHTPLIQDRFLSIESAKYVFNTMNSLSSEISFNKKGIIQNRAEQVLNEALNLLEKISDIGLMNSLSKGWFAEIKRLPDGGKGLNGVVARDENYLNPFISLMLKGEDINES